MRFFLINSLRKGGGAEKQCIRIAQEISTSKIITLEKSDHWHAPVLSLYSLKMDYAQSWIIRFGAIPFLVSKLKKYIRGASVVVSFLEFANIINILTSFISRHKVVICERTTPSKNRGTIQRMLMHTAIKYLYPYAHKILCNSYGVKNNLVTHFKIKPSQIDVIYNGYEIKDYSLTNIYNLQKTPICISVGRLIPVKGHMHLIRCFASVKKTFLSAKLVLIGEGILREKLIDLCNEFELRIFNADTNNAIDYSSDIFFMGYQDDPYYYLKQSTIFLLTSLYEGFPNVVVESMICGTPVMSADCRSGPREILSPDTDFRYETQVPEYAKYGILMPVLDGVWRKACEPLTQTEQIWVDEIVKVLRDEQLRQRYSELGRQRAQDFSIEKIIPQWEEVIREVEK